MKGRKSLLSTVSTWIPHTGPSQAAANDHTPVTVSSPTAERDVKEKQGPASQTERHLHGMTAIKGVAGGLSNQFKDLLSRGTNAMALLSAGHIPGARQDADVPDDDADDDDSNVMRAAENPLAPRLKFSTVTIEQSDQPASRASLSKLSHLKMAARPWNGEVYSFHDRRFVMKSTVWKLKFKQDPPPEEKDMTPPETPAIRSAENSPAFADQRRVGGPDAQGTRGNPRVGKVWKDMPRRIVPISKERMTLALDGGGGLHMCPCDVPDGEGVIICNLANIVSCYKTDVAPPYEDAFTMVYLVPGGTDGGEESARKFNIHTTYLRALRQSARVHSHHVRAFWVA
jgi:hypothetical protein